MVAGSAEYARETTPRRDEDIFTRLNFQFQRDANRHTSGVRDSRLVSTTEAECLEALQRAADILGESPTKAQYENLGLTPAAATILRVVGGWNAAKERAGLQTNPSTGSRLQPMPDEVVLPEGETWAEFTQDQRWHYRNVDWNTERTLERRDRMRSWLYELKRDCGGCSNCAEQDPACLDFHHVDAEEKTMAINEMVTFGYGREKILEELEHCVVLCANCHARVHYSHDIGSGIGDTFSEPFRNRPQGRPYIRQWSWQYQEREGCRDCTETDPRCLQFHHPEEGAKSDGVGALISDGEPFEVVRAEVETSAVLCANCHRKVHYEVPAHVGESDTV